MHVRRWGGARAGAGRPAKGPIPSERHQRRPALTLATRGVHIVARVEARSLGRVLRRRDATALFARAIDLARERADFQILHLAIRGAQIELVVEANDRLALARGMQGFQVSAARSLNRAARRTGRVFVDRYRALALASPAAVERAIARLR